MGRTGAGLCLSQAAEMTVWLYANQILQGLSQIHTRFFFICLPWDLTSAVLLFHLVVKVLCLTGPCHFFHLGSSSLGAAGTARMRSSARPGSVLWGLSFTSFCSAQINNVLWQTRLQEFLIFIILMRTTFPVWKLECISPVVDPGPDDIRPLSLLCSQTDRVCHSRQIFIYWTSFPYASSWWMYKNTVIGILKPKIY